MHHLRPRAKMFPHRKKLRPLDPASSDDEDSDDSSDSPEDTEPVAQEERPCAMDRDGDNMNQEVEHATMPAIPVDEGEPGPSQPFGSALQFSLDAFDLFPSGGPYELPPNFSIMDFPPPTPGGPGVESPVPMPSAGRDSPQPGTSRAAMAAMLLESQSQPQPPLPIPTIIEPEPGPSTSAVVITSTSRAAIAAQTRHRSSARLNPKPTLTIPKAPRPITAVRANKNDPTGKSNPKSSLRRIYSDLIEKCQGFEEEGLESDLQKVMTANISEGNRLFEGLKRLGGGPGDMLLAFLHTQMCSQVIRYKSYTIGSTTSGFKMDQLLKAMLGEHTGGTNDSYSPRILTRQVAKEAADACRSVPYLDCLIGTFDREFHRNQKDKKQRVSRKRVVDPNQSATQHEELSMRGGEKENRSPETLKVEIFKILKNLERAGIPKMNLLEFILDKNSFANSVEYLFYVGFLIRDGYLALLRQRENRMIGDSGLIIKPDKPIQKQILAEEEVSGVCRNQYILSFSPRMWRQLAAAATGDDIITMYRTMNTRP